MHNYKQYYITLRACSLVPPFVCLRSEDYVHVNCDGMLVYPFLTRTTTNNFPVVLGPTKIRCTKNASLITSIYNHLTSSKQALQWDESLLQEGVKIWIFLSQLDISANSERNEWFWWTWKHVTVRKGWISDNNISRKWKHEASNIRI